MDAHHCTTKWKNPVPTQSSTESQLSIFLPHTSMKCGNTVTAELFCWMVGKQSLGCWSILGYDRNLVFLFIFIIKETNQSCHYQGLYDTSDSYIYNIYDIINIFVNIQLGSLKEPELAAAWSSGETPGVPSSARVRASRGVLPLETPLAMNCKPGSCMHHAYQS